MTTPITHPRAPLRSRLARRYKNPPVHEVILDLTFQSQLDDERLRALRSVVGASFPQAEEMNTTELMFSMGPAGQEIRAGSKQFGGWQLKDNTASWILQLTRTQCTLHAVRPGRWPSGAYMGWDAILDHFRDLHATLAASY